MRIVLLVCALVMYSSVARAQSSYGSTGDYEQDTIISDGPIHYGTGLSDADRATAWKSFFLKMAEAHHRQYGEDSLKIKLMRRCQPGEDICVVMFDANLVGIGGIREPRMVIVAVATDAKDPNKQVQRVVCTRPAEGVQICRDWDTGKLIRDKDGR